METSLYLEKNKQDETLLIKILVDALKKELDKLVETKKKENEDLATKSLASRNLKDLISFFLDQRQDLYKLEVNWVFKDILNKSFIIKNFDSFTKGRS